MLRLASATMTTWLLAPPAVARRGAMSMRMRWGFAWVPTRLSERRGVGYCCSPVSVCSPTVSTCEPAASSARRLAEGLGGAP